MRICVKCGELKDNFYTENRNTCIDCTKLRAKLYAQNNKEIVLKNKKEYYEKNKNKFKEYNKEIQAPKRKIYRNEIRAWVNSLKEGKPCADCHQVFPSICMDFDHIDPATKLKSVSRLIQQKYSKENIIKEIEKCELVCANCHRLRTKNSRKIRKSKIRSYTDTLKSNPCVDCGKIFDPHCMDFDHRDPATKYKAVSALSNLEEIKIEVEKCDLVCIVCHRKRTAIKSNWGM